MQPLLPWKSNMYHILRVCVCNLRHPACNAYAPYCHLWPAWLYHILPHYLTNGTIFENKLLNIKCVFWFFLQLLSGTFLIIRRSERDMIKIIYWSSCKVPVILVRFKWNLSLSDRFSKNIQIWNFIKIRLVGEELLHAAGQKRRHDEPNCRFSQFPNAPTVQVT